MTTTAATRNAPAHHRAFVHKLPAPEPETLAVLATRALNAKVNGTGADFDQAQVALQRGFIRAGISPNLLSLLVQCEVVS